MRSLASPRDPRSEPSGRSALALAACLLGACALDSTGGDPPSSAASSSSGETSSSGEGPGPSSTATSSSGQGAGPSSSSGGDGGDGAATSTGGGGSSASQGGGGAGGRGDGGDGGGGAGQGGGTGGSGGTGSGGGGGEGGGGPLSEWFLRVFGNDNQVVNDVAFSLDGRYVYVVGTARQDPTTFETDPGLPLDPDVDDIFVAKVNLEGPVVEWFRIYGEDGDDQGKSIAVGLDSNNVEHVFIAGTANGNTGGFADAFEGEPNARWMFATEVAANNGDAGKGTWWPHDNINLAVDVAVTSRGAVATGTVKGFTDSHGSAASGDDVIVAIHAFATDTYDLHVVTNAGDQRGIAVAADDNGGFAVLGEFNGNTFDADLPLTPGLCPVVVSGSQDDIFLAFYSVSDSCRTIKTYGSVGDDRAGGLAVAGTDAYLTLRAPGNIFSATSGSYAVKASFSSAGPVWTTRLLDESPNKVLMSIALGGGGIGVAGRTDNTGFIQALGLDGTSQPPRLFTGATVQARTLAIRGGRWITGGLYNGTPDFGGTILTQEVSISDDGWIAQMAPPL